jgi:hypothetical protein
VVVGEGGVILTSQDDNTSDVFHPGLRKYGASGIKINSSRNMITVQVPQPEPDGGLTVGFFNAAGKRIFSASQASNGMLNIPVSGLTSGIYLMSITGKNTALSSPFVKTK